MILTLADLCGATPGELEEATKIFANMKKEQNRLQQLGIGSQYEVETKDFYNLYLKATEFPDIVKTVYAFKAGQDELRIFEGSEYEEFLRSDFIWGYFYGGKVYQTGPVTNAEVVFEMLKYDYLLRTLSTFHPSYEGIKPQRYGDMPWHFADFVKRTERLYLNEKVYKHPKRYPLQDTFFGGKEKLCFMKK